ncbi:MAG: thermonuclease family protein [Giesbergeria sp.]
MSSAAALVCLVVSIADGDTLTARCGQPGAYEQVKVRLSAIDAPEKRQPFGNVSRQHLAALCFQEQSTITPKARDRYGRTVADVECKGQDAGTEQVRADLAWYYVKYGKGYKHLRTLEAQARQDKRGCGRWRLWRRGSCVRDDPRFETLVNALECRKAKVCTNDQCVQSQPKAK